MFSKLSILFAVIGTLFLGRAQVFSNDVELFMACGFASLMIGSALSFFALLKRELGKIKYIAIIAFFVLSFIITWNDPFEMIRMLTWMKNL